MYHFALLLLVRIDKLNPLGAMQLEECCAISIITMSSSSSSSIVVCMCVKTIISNILHIDYVWEKNF